MEKLNFATTFDSIVNYCCKALHLRTCWDSGYTSRNSETWTKCNNGKLQHAKSATGEECKTKTLQRESTTWNT